MKKIVFSLFVFSGLFSCSENNITPIFPNTSTVNSFSAASNSFLTDWYGEWSGNCNLYSPGKTGAQDKFTMKLNISADTKNKRWNWQIIYKSPKINQVRDYFLIPVNPSAGHYAVDENNGIILDSFILNKNTILEQFSVDNSNITVKHQLIDRNNLKVEFITFSNQQIRESGAQGYNVNSFKLLNYQDCSLQK